MEADFLILLAEEVVQYHQGATLVDPQLQDGIRVVLLHQSAIRDDGSRSTSSPINKSPSTGSVERKNANEKLKKEGKKRHQQEAELKLLEDEAARRVEEVIMKKVKESLNCEEIKMEIQRRLEEDRKKLDEVAAQLEKEKEVIVTEARLKEEKARKEKEELERMIEENCRMVEEAQRRVALEQQQREEEHYRELEELQRPKEEAMQRKKQQEEEKVNQMELLGKNKSRPKLSFAIGL